MYKVIASLKARAISTNLNKSIRWVFLNEISAWKSARLCVQDWRSWWMGSLNVWDPLNISRAGMLLLILQEKETSVGYNVHVERAPKNAYIGAYIIHHGYSSQIADFILIWRHVLSARPHASFYISRGVCARYVNLLIMSFLLYPFIDRFGRGYTLMVKVGKDTAPGEGQAQG